MMASAIAEAIRSQSALAVSPKTSFPVPIIRQSRKDTTRDQFKRTEEKAPHPRATPSLLRTGDQKPGGLTLS